MYTLNVYITPQLSRCGQREQHVTFDVHAHCVPDELLGYLRTDGPALGIELEDTPRGPILDFAGQLRTVPLPGELMDVPGRLSAMDAAGVDTQLLSHRTDLSAYALEPSHGATYARAFNRILTELAGEAPDRFLTLGTVPLQSPREAAAELEHAVVELGMVGVEIASNVNGVTLGRLDLDPFWEVANATRCLVLLHPYEPLKGVDLSEYWLHNMVGRPAESTVSIGQLLFSGVLERYPDLVVCLVHGGGFLPYQLGRFEKGYTAVPEQTATRISSPPGDFARRLYYDSLVHSPAALEFLVRTMGADHVVVGSDYPYEMHDPQPVNSVRDATSLSDAEVDQILTGNVERIIREIRR